MSAPERPLPVPPEPPVEGSCCGRGCEWCVWVYYDQALRRYEAARAQWREQQDDVESHVEHGATHPS